MSVFELTLTQFIFPTGLPNDKANFRFVVDLRFTNDKGQFTTEHAVMPSLDTFWECDTRRRDRPNYVRNCLGHTDSKDHDEACSQFNMVDKKVIDEWDRLILIVKGESIHSIQFKVIDVNRKDAWDTVKKFLGGIIEAVIGKIKGVLQGNLRSLVSGSLGGAADDLQSFLLKKLAGGDNVLFRGSAQLTAPEDGEEENRTITSGNCSGCGTGGDYCIKFELTKDGQKQKPKIPKTEGSADTNESGDPTGNKG